MGGETCPLGEQIHGTLSYLTTGSCHFLSSRISVNLSVDDNQREWRSLDRNWQITTAKLFGDLTHGSVLDIHCKCELYSCKSYSSHHYLAPGVICHCTVTASLNIQHARNNSSSRLWHPWSYKHSASEHCAPTSLYSEQVSWHLNFMLTFVSSWNKIATSRVFTKQIVADNTSIIQHLQLSVTYCSCLM